ncbi:MAG: phosphatidylserine decarboxylase [Pseudomonadota bacterium]|jgi:phosphatidylserine decarboxylase
MDQETFMTLMRLLPRSALSHAVGRATRLNVPPWMHQAVIRKFAEAYKVNLDEAELPVEGYPTFLDFFTRRLKPGVRPVDAAAEAVVSPVDGCVSQLGYALEGKLVQAKGITYTAGQLLGDAAAAAPFEGGAWATIYLAPRDYHRIHSPLGGEVEGYGYIPGEFWPVNAASVALVDALFCVNERLVTYLRTPAGRVAVVKVGATNVSRIRATYDDVITHTDQPGKQHRYGKAIPVEKGGELGVFEMGSTVILLFEKGRVTWDAQLKPDQVVRMGERVGTFQ